VARLIAIRKTLSKVLEQKPDTNLEKLSLAARSKRRTLQQVGSVLFGFAMGDLSSRADAQVRPGSSPQTPADPTKRLGPRVSAYGTRSRFENNVVRWQYKTPTNESSWTMTPLHDQRGIITPASLQYERHHAGVPDIDPAQHRLLIIGMVDRPLKLSLLDLMRYPASTRICFTECSGNTLTEWVKPTLDDVQQTHGLVCGTEWTGVLLSTLLREVGIRQTAKWIVAEGADGARMNRSIPLEKAMEDAMIAYGQNGEALYPSAGYPMRLVLPGWEGSTNVKWLRVMKVTDKPYYTREETSKYTDLMGDGSSRIFTLVMDAKSVITYPSRQYPVPGSGFTEIRGLAWSGRGKIVRVQVSTDSGKTWGTAKLEEPILSKSLTLFRFPWNWRGQETVLQSRCTDETGYVQPTREALVKVRGLNGTFGSFYHYNAIQSWRVASDGSIHNVHA
jgi:sulfane dehydrogenase subunit SoxC